MINYRKFQKNYNTEIWRDEWVFRLILKRLDVIIYFCTNDFSFCVLSVFNL